MPMYLWDSLVSWDGDDCGYEDISVMTHTQRAIAIVSAAQHHAIRKEIGRTLGAANLQKN